MLILASYLAFMQKTLKITKNVNLYEFIKKLNIIKSNLSTPFEDVL